MAKLLTDQEIALLDAAVAQAEAEEALRAKEVADLTAMLNAATGRRLAAQQNAGAARALAQKMRNAERAEAARG